MQRYLALAHHDVEHGDGIAGQVEHLTGMKPAFTSPSITLMTPAHDTPCIQIGEQGVLVGRAFHRHGPPAAIDEFSPADIAAILNSSGTRLIDRFWGGYIALFETPEGVQVIRDPSAALLCFHFELPGTSVFASDAALLREAGLLAPRIHWRNLARILFTNGLPSVDTAIDGVSELLPGTSITVGRGIHEERVSWSPWDHVNVQPDLGSLMPEQLRRTVRQSVHAWASCYRRILIGISGGLDSSIVASCANSASSDLACMTVATRDRDGDERLFASLMCNHIGRSLSDEFYSLADIDLQRSAAPHLPFPISRSQSLSYDACVARQATMLSIDAFFTGNGGDNVFAFSQSATPLYDRYLHEGLGLGLLETLGNICRLTGCSPWQALRAVWKKSQTTSPRYSWRTNSLFLAPDIIAAEVEVPISHKWLDAPKEALPGKAAHIAGILQIQRHLHASEQNIGIPIVNPLLAQPVLELCLSIPSWQWCGDGLNRAVARRAFADDLPPAVTFRTTKGRPDSFCSEIITAFRQQIRERLLDGHLAKNRLLDVAVIEKMLSSQAPNLGIEAVRFMTLVEAEAWLDEWIDSRSIINSSAA